MTSSRFSEVAFRSHYLCSPVDPATIEEALSHLVLGDTDRVLDIGCGKGRLLVEIVDRFGCSGLGIDVDETFIAAARELAGSRGLQERIEFRCTDATQVTLEPGFALAACLGSTHVYGTLLATIEALRTVVVPAGHLLLGEGFWRREPDPEYLERLGSAPDELTSHLGNIAAIQGTGLEVVYSHESTLQEWDDFEGLYARSVHEYVAANPEDPEAGQMLDRIERWEDTVERWGRDTLGFGLYLAQVPGEVDA